MVAGSGIAPSHLRCLPACLPHEGVEKEFVVRPYASTSSTHKEFAVPWSNLTPYTICQQETNHYQLDVPKVWQMLAMNCNEGTMLNSRQVAQVKSGRLSKKNKTLTKTLAHTSVGNLKARIATASCKTTKIASNII